MSRRRAGPLPEALIRQRHRDAGAVHLARRRRWAAGTPGATSSGLVGPKGVISACVKPNGVVRIIAPSGACKGNETPISWNQAAQAGPAGTFTGQFTSPSGAYSLTANDDGISLDDSSTGATSSLTMAGGAIDASSAADLNLKSAAALDVKAVSESDQL